MRQALWFLSFILLLTSPSASHAEEKWISLFDGKTLGSWQETNFASGGEVTVKDGHIILPQGGDLSGINLKEAPATQNYEITLSAQKTQGSDFFCALTFPIGEKCSTFVVGGWGGSVTGISSINGCDASENGTTRFMKYEEGRWYRIRVKVTDKTLQAWVDEELMVNIELEGLKIDMRAGEIELSKPLGIASFRTKSALKDIAWRKVK